MENPTPPVVGTYYSDPAAIHTVNVLSEALGGGIYGYYKFEFAAERVARWARKLGARATVEPYQPDAPV